MKISISTAGWRPGKTAVSAVLSLLLGLAAVPAVGRELPVADQDLLEFLGTFETAAGKAIDPLAFRQTGKAAASPPAKGVGKQRRRETGRRATSAAAGGKRKDQRND